MAAPLTTLRVQQVGLQATVQDLGRPGLAHLGVPTAGAVDRGGIQTANRLVGNDDAAAVLELVLRGGTFTVSGETRIAVVGAQWSVDGHPAHPDSPHVVSAGATIEVAPAGGVYTYVAVAGGIDVPQVLGSRSTDTLSAIGQEALKPGDILAIGDGTVDQTATRLPPTRADGPLHVVLGPRDDWFTDDALTALLEAEWTVTPTSDRVGLRLSGRALQRRKSEQLPSEGMVTGAIQVPPDGQPILFLANHPTTGGYPVIAVVASTDVDRAAQSRPGAKLRFQRMA